MNTKMEQFPVKNPNPVLSVANDGTVLYSNDAGEPLLREWGVRVGEKLPPNIADFVQRVISRNSPERMEVKVGKRVYLVAFHPLLEEDCVNVYGFDISDQKELEEKLRESEARYRDVFEKEDCKSSFILTVSDNGVGIPENLEIEDLESLGMQLVTTLVKQLDG